MKALAPSLFFFIFAVTVCHAQLAPHVYWIQFTDKNHNKYTLSQPLDFLSPRAIERRQRQGIGFSESDLPVSTPYLDSMRAIGGKVLFTSRWQNAAAVYSADSNFIVKAEQISIVKSGIKVYKKGMEVHAVSQSMVTAFDNIPESTYGASFGQIHMHHGEEMHNSGFQGQGMVIAQLDAGFYKVDSLTAFKKLRDRKGILGVHDFIGGGDTVYNKDQHGMICLSVMAGYLPGKLVGTAPEADYYLIRTENAPAENEVEEAAWTAGLEMADSAGADVINSSLGYTQFDDPTTNHYYEDLDGHTTICSREASMAASKGMIVCNSAGNNGQRSWYYISAPADAENILTVGAVGADRRLARYSSRGKTYDGRVKPDVMATGYQTVSASTYDGDVAGANGTSLSSPVITGLTACLWQEFRGKTAYEIMDAIKKSADRFTNPDDSFGYGIPDYALARQLLKMDNHNPDFLGTIYPNPFTSNFSLTFYTSEAQTVDIEVSNAIGQRISMQSMATRPDNFNQAYISLPLSAAAGVYMVTAKTKNGLLVQKVVHGSR